MTYNNIEIDYMVDDMAYKLRPDIRRLRNMAWVETQYRKVLWAGCIEKPVINRVPFK